MSLCYMVSKLSNFDRIDGWYSVYIFSGDINVPIDVSAQA